MKIHSWAPRSTLAAITALRKRFRSSWTKLEISIHSTASLHCRLHALEVGSQIFFKLDSKIQSLFTDKCSRIRLTFTFGATEFGELLEYDEPYRPRPKFQLWRCHRWPCSSTGSRPLGSRLWADTPRESRLPRNKKRSTLNLEDTS